MRLHIFMIKKCRKWELIIFVLAVILIEFVLKKAENYYPQVFLRMQSRPSIKEINRLIRKEYQNIKYLL